MSIQLAVKTYDLIEGDPTYMALRTEGLLKEGYEFHGPLHILPNGTVLREMVKYGFPNDEWGDTI